MELQDHQGMYVAMPMFLGNAMALVILRSSKIYTTILYMPIISTTASKNRLDYELMKLCCIKSYHFL